MPSIPQSLLWISLVVLWLFVLVPMLISKRDTVRRTSDVALATRVLNTGRARDCCKRAQPAAGHRSDPDWQPSDDDLDDDLDEDDDDDDRRRSRASRVVGGAAAREEVDRDRLPRRRRRRGGLRRAAGRRIARRRDGPCCHGTRRDPTTFDERRTSLHEVDETPAPESSRRRGARRGPETQSTDELEPTTRTTAPTTSTSTSRTLWPGGAVGYRSAARPTRSRPRAAAATSPKTAAAVSARKYTFRKRMLTGDGRCCSVSAAAAYLMLADARGGSCGSVGAVTVLYLGYLRRQTRIEERLRRRRAQRMARSRLGVENTDDHEFDVVPSRLRRPGVVVLEIDDEDPIFEHLDYAPFARDFDLPRAAGQ